MALADNSVFFAGNDLSIIVGATLIDHNFNDLPSRELSMSKLARANKSVLTSAEYSSKEVTVSFHLRGCDRGDTEIVLSTLKSYLSPVNKPLIVSQAHADVTYPTATLNELNYEWLSNKILITLVFTVADPIGYQDITTSLVNKTITTASDTSPITISGSFEAEPIISAILTTVTGAVAQSMSFRNGDTGQGITITRTWANGDTVQVDVANKVVYINSAISDFTGQFPVFATGSQSLTYSDTFTTRSLALSATYKIRFL